MKKQANLLPLTTPFEENPSWNLYSWNLYSWNLYPRPQMVRGGWMILDGEWELFRMRDGGMTREGSVTVPYVPESRLSGISATLRPGEAWVYRRDFSLHAYFCIGRVLLHFGAADQIAAVKINGEEVGCHAGGYLPFTFDITELLNPGPNSIQVEVRDDLDPDYGYGKQRQNRGGMWYTPFSGIWQTVWVESVPDPYIRDLKITPALDSVTIRTEGGEEEKLLEIETPEGIVTHRYRGDSITVPVENPRLWSPESPHLYPFTLTSGKDTVRSYFALRTMTVESRGGRRYLCLNGKPYFFHGILDQGYYSDGICLPASPEGYRFDILTMRSLGFNMLRKHIKIEPEVFYHECDRLGMIVFQDMVNSGKYSFFADTALPTVGIRKALPRRVSDTRREQFQKETEATVQLLYNHPCVCCYTIFNEGWGQFDADENYDRLRAMDPTRIWDATSGWFHGKRSDVDSEHVYFRRLKLREGKRPLVLSEFGGYACPVEGHLANPEKAYGYKSIEDPAALTESLRRLYLDEVIPMLKRGLCAAVLTQVSDVEDEINGLVTYDRQVVKPDGDAMREIARRLREAFDAEAGQE